MIDLSQLPILQRLLLTYTGLLNKCGALISGIYGCNKIYEKWFYTLRNLMNYLESSPLFPTLLVLFELESSKPILQIYTSKQIFGSMEE